METAVLIDCTVPNEDFAAGLELHIVRLSLDHDLYRGLVCFRAFIFGVGVRAHCPGRAGVGL